MGTSFKFVPFGAEKTSASILVKEGAYNKVRSEKYGQMENGTFSLKKSVNVKQCMRKVRVYYKYRNSKLTGTNQLSS